MLQIVQIETQLPQQQPRPQAAANPVVVQPIGKEPLLGPLRGSRADQVRKRPEGALVLHRHLTSDVAVLSGEASPCLHGLRTGNHQNAGLRRTPCGLSRTRQPEILPVSVGPALVVHVVGAQQDRDHVRPDRGEELVERLLFNAAEMRGLPQERPKAWTIAPPGRTG